MLTPARPRPVLRPLALVVSLGVLLGTLLTGVASASTETGTLTLRLQGLLGNTTERISGGCYRIFGYDNGNPSIVVREHVCAIGTDVLALTNLPVPPDREYLVQEVTAPGSILREGSTWVTEMQFGMVEPFDARVGEEIWLSHVPAGSAVVNRIGAKSETDPSALENAVGCYYVERESVSGQLGQRRGPFCGFPVTDLEPDFYRFTGNPFSDHLGGSHRMYVGAQQHTVVPVEAPIAPDLRVKLVDPQGRPLTNVCFHVLAVQVPGWETGREVEVGCDSYPGPLDGLTTIVDLTPGTYTLVQRWAPNDYRVAPDRQVTVHSLPFACPGSECPPPNEVTVVNQPLTGGNTAPVVSDDAAQVDEDSSVPVAVLANDSDPDGDAMTASLVTAPMHGAVVADAEGRLRYTPEADWHGTDSFQYAAGDGTHSTTGTVRVVVRPVNDAPVARQDAASTAGTAPVTVAVLANDVDVDGDALTAAAGAAPAHGTVQATADGRLTYTAAAGFAGTDTFTYAASDGTTSTTATVTVTVAPVAPPPAGVDAAVDAVRALLADVPAPHDRRLAQRLDQVVKHLGGDSACTHVAQLTRDVTRPAFVRAVGDDLAGRLEDAVAQLASAVGCP